jgi:signal transduction histidine kinase
MLKTAAGPSKVHQQPVSPAYTMMEDGHDPKESRAETVAMSRDMAAMLTRASHLIRESISVEGCVFLDASGATTENFAVFSGSDEEESISGSTSSERTLINDEDLSSWNSARDEGRGPLSSDMKSGSQRSMCEVLGYSVEFAFKPGDGQANPTFQFPKDTLHRLLQRYPNGSILNFEENGGVCFSDEELNTNVSNMSMSNKDESKSAYQESTNAFEEIDNQVILDTFPGIRRLAFFPLWDTTTKSWFCGAFAWTNNPFRVLDADDDMAYLTAFGNSVMAEKARLDAYMVDRMKSNFISTVSHELRSPLHGILASVELLNDMSLSLAQLDVTRMINTCGQTLLDTINHVLDFTELNRLRNWAKQKKEGEDTDEIKTQTQSQANSSQQNANMDLSMLVEEVVGSTLAGHHFDHSSSQLMPGTSSQLLSFEMQSSLQLRRAASDTIGGVKVVMDIDRRSSWVTNLQPGAWKRIVMNLFGNALKYTRDGHVYVSLKSVANVSKQDSRPLVLLTVQDTGKGISQEFLKHHIFKPFWQEDSLAAGTGLGLSIVHQIVRDFGGHIEIKSKEGSGTQITVQLPLDIPDPTPALSPALSPAIDDSMYFNIRQRMKGLKVSIISSKALFERGNGKVLDTFKPNAASDLLMMKSLCKTLKDWFQMEVVEYPLADSAIADVYLLLTDDLPSPGTKNDAQISRLVETNALIVLWTGPASLNQKAIEMQKVTHVIQQP